MSKSSSLHASRRLQVVITSQVEAALQYLRHKAESAAQCKVSETSVLVGLILRAAESKGWKMLNSEEEKLVSTPEQGGPISGALDRVLDAARLFGPSFEILMRPMDEQEAWAALPEATRQAYLR
jgi:hypothetical protein